MIMKMQERISKDTVGVVQIVYTKPLRQREKASSQGRYFSKDSEI